MPRIWPPMLRCSLLTFLGSCLILLGSTPSVLGDEASEKERGQLSNDTLLWGPYRPNIYFGTRPRIPNSLITGLLWSRVEDFQSVQNSFRHTCEQGDGMAGYGWEEYDIRRGGRQVMYDKENALDIHTEFVKVPGGQNGGSWGVRVRGTPREDAPQEIKSTVVFYLGVEGSGKVGLTTEGDERGFEGEVAFEGKSDGLGVFSVSITEGPDTNAHPVHQHPSYEVKPLDRTFVNTHQVPEEHIWQSKALLFNSIRTTIDASVEEYGAEKSPPPWQLFTVPNSPSDGNLHFVQKVFDGPFEFDVLYSSESGTRMTSERLSEEIESNSRSFAERFDQKMAPLAPFNKPKYDKFTKSLFSNLVGGIGYFYGPSIVDRSNAPEYEEENEGFWEEAAEARARRDVTVEGPSELFTSVPSRPFFPRGFIWDEGFHLLPILDWDVDLTLQIIRSWFSLMDEDGWIAREQILGAEARSKVPPEFQVQYPQYANPPTLFLVLEEFVNKLHEGGSELHRQTTGQQPVSDIRDDHLTNLEAGKEYLRSLYPLLKRYYFWFRRTQRGEVSMYEREAYSSREAYRWRGRTPQHILTSGLDDYPRAPIPHPGELHLDLISWIGMMSRSMSHIASTLGEKEDAADFKQHEDAIIKNIDDLHWDEKAHAYCDATIDEYEEDVHVCHEGYISLFPFMTGLLAPENPRMDSVLDLIADPGKLWSDYGIRSLSKSDEFYGTSENYWRSPVWININYLVLTRLLNLAHSESSHKARARDLYTKLRNNLVTNVFEQWEKTGFAWEQYNPDTGEGQRTAHFTGWTSLISKIMKMPNLSPSDKKRVHDEL